MALVSAAELRASREAIQANVQNVSDDAAELAVLEAEAALYSDAVLGYRIEVEDASITVQGSGTGYLTLPERIRSITTLVENGTTITSTGYEVVSNGFRIERIGGYLIANADYPSPERWGSRDIDIVITGEFGYEATDAEWILAKKWVRIAAVDYLKQTRSTSGLPSNLTDYSAEGASFSFSADASGRSDLARLIEQIGRHPYKRKGITRSVEMRAAR